MKLIGFRPSTKKDKKIDAILEDKKTGKNKIVSFGLKGSTTYSNKTGVGSDPIHNDKRLQDAYLKRHKNDGNIKYSAGYFAKKYLWS